MLYTSLERKLQTQWLLVTENLLHFIRQSGCALWLVHDLTLCIRFQFTISPNEH